MKMSIPQGIYRPGHIRGTVAASQHGEFRVIQRLRPQGDPVDPLAQILPGSCPADGFRVGFHADFSRAVQSETAGGPVQNAADDRGRQQTGRTTSEKYGPHGGTAQPVTPLSHFQNDIVHPELHALRRFIKEPSSDGFGIKSAVAALGTTKRDMYIQQHGGSMGKSRTSVKSLFRRMGKRQGMRKTAQVDVNPALRYIRCHSLPPCAQALWTGRAKQDALSDQFRKRRNPSAALSGHLHKKDASCLRSAHPRRARFCTRHWLLR